jgi:integrase/recombinase XerD
MQNLELLPWLQRFFQEYLSSQRNVSPATLAAYRDTFRLLFRYLKRNRRAGSVPLPLAILTPDVILGFLDQLERKRGNCIRTRNARLAAIRSFVHYLSDWLGPDLPPALPRILGIPFKRHVQRLVGFLTGPEVQTLLAATGDTWTGRRNHLLFLLLYNTGARISEILALRVKDISPQERHIDLSGKGRKQRRVPLWNQTHKRLRQWLRNHPGPPEAPLLPNRFGQRLTRAGAAHQLQQLLHRASVRDPALKKRRISPHSFRHATAMALLEASVPTEVIALYLGHESPKSTHPYVEASLAMKKKALMKLSPPTNRFRFRPAPDDLQFLDNL